MSYLFSLSLPFFFKFFCIFLSSSYSSFLCFFFPLVNYFRTMSFYLSFLSFLSPSSLPFSIFVCPFIYSWILARSPSPPPRSLVFLGPEQKPEQQSLKQTHTRKHKHTRPLSVSMYLLTPLHLVFTTFRNPVTRSKGSLAFFSLSPSTRIYTKGKQQQQQQEEQQKQQQKQQRSNKGNERGLLKRNAKYNMANCITMVRFDSFFSCLWCMR